MILVISWSWNLVKEGVRENEESKTILSDWEGGDTINKRARIKKVVNNKVRFYFTLKLMARWFANLNESIFDTVMRRNSRFRRVKMSKW